VVEDWNLGSLFANPFNSGVSVVQIPIAGQYVVIQGFDQGGPSYYPDLPPGLNTLEQMDAEHGARTRITAGTGAARHLSASDDDVTPRPGSGWAPRPGSG